MVSLGCAEAYKQEGLGWRVLPLRSFLFAGGSHRAVASGGCWDRGGREGKQAEARRPYVSRTSWESVFIT